MKSKIEGLIEFKTKDGLASIIPDNITGVIEHECENLGSFTIPKYVLIERSNGSNIHVLGEYLDIVTSISEAKINKVKINEPNG